jgi:hypothetical protein
VNTQTNLFTRRVLLLLPLIAAVTLRAATAPSGLLCQLMEHPEETVITARAPEFGWMYNPSFRNDVQQGYRIIVASSQPLADLGTGDVWDSGLMTNAASINLPYVGPALQANTDYFWRVQTRDGNGQLSPLSAAQHFRTDTQLAAPPIVTPTTNGLKWVWYPETALANTARYFRKTFVIPASPGVAGAQFLLTADDQFTLHVNGILAGNSINWKQFSLVPLSGLLQPGTNTLAIMATNISSGAGLTGKLQYLGSDGSTNTVFIDDAWRASQTGPAGWNQAGFDDSAWTTASLLGNYGISPWNTTATLPLGGVIYQSSTNAWANRYPLRFVAAPPVLVTNTAPGRWFIDFGQDAFGYATVHLNGAYSGTTVQARFGEMASGTAVNTAPSGTVRYGVSTFTLQSGDMTYPVRPPSNSGQTIIPPTAFGVVLPFRYLELTNCPGTLTVTDVVQLRLEYEFNTNAATFDSSSPALNQVWSLCRNSMQILSFDGVYVDGDRERKPYEADAYIQQLSHYAVDREFTLARYSQEYLLVNPTWPFEWKFHSILLAGADYLQTGNPDLLFAHYDVLKSKLFLDRTRADGLLKGFPNNNQNVNDDIVDWPAADRDGYVISSGSYSNYYSSVNNAFFYRCLQIMANAATLTGHTNDAADFTARANQVYASYNPAFWNPATQRYLDGEGTTHSAAHASFFPLAFGLVPATNQAAVLAFLHTKAMVPSVYGAQYLLEGLFQSGDADYALGLMTTNSSRSWLNMLNLGSTLTTEAWSFTDKSNEDWNHAWGAAAGNIIPRFVLGLRPLAAGYGRVLIQPQLGQSLSHVQGTVPTIRGPVFIQASRVTNQFQLLLTLPGNVTATVMVPGTNSTALVDGNIVAGTVSNGWLTVTNIGSGQHAIWSSPSNQPSPAMQYSNWASAWFGSNATNPAIAGPTANPYGGSLNNYDKFVAGLDPTDPQSKFTINGAAYVNSPPGLSVTLSGVAGRAYTLVRTLSLSSPAWVTVATNNVLTLDQPVTLTDPQPSPLQAFYRVYVTKP